MRKIISKLLIMFMMFSTIYHLSTLLSVSYGVEEGSYIKVTPSDGNVTVHVHDDFNDGVINTDIWAPTDDFEETSGYVVSLGGVGTLKLKGDYSGYDEYRFSVDLVNIADQDDFLTNKKSDISNGGIGINHGNMIWVYDEVMRRNNNNYRREVRKAKFTNDSLINLDRVSSKNIEKWGLYSKIDPNTSIRLDVHIFRDDLPSKERYRTVIQSWKISNGTSIKLKNVEYTTYRYNVDFEEIMLVAVANNNNWVVSFDNFDFTATKPGTFDSLKASWSDDVYKLTWNPVQGASEYRIYYKDGATSNFVSTIEASDSDLEKVAFIEDDSPFNDKIYYVTAVVDGNEDASNEVLLYGDVTSKFELSGSFNDNDYDLSWSEFIIGGNPDFTYDIYHGDKQSNVNSTVNNESISKEIRTYNFEEVQSTSEYYGDYLQVAATINDATYGQIKFYSNQVQMKAEVRLGLNVVEDEFIFEWKPESYYDQYYLFRDEDYSKLSDPVTNGLDYDRIDNIDLEVNPNGKIYIKRAINNEEYLNKYFVLVGNDAGDHALSNIIQAKASNLTPVLTWSHNNENQQVYTWDTIEGATKVELYYGKTADKIDLLLSADPSLVNNSQFITDTINYENKYVRARFFKNDIWYYSNVVRTTDLEIGSAEFVVDDNDDSEEVDYNFDVNWNDIVWPEDGTEANQRISSYEIYFEETEGVFTLIEKNLKDSQYIISDIYGDNNKYIGKRMIIKSICTVRDEFDNTHNLTVDSNPIIPRRIVFDSLKDSFNDVRDYTVSWSIPIEQNVDSQTITSDHVEYELVYGTNKDVNDKQAIVLVAPYPNELSQTWPDVTEDGGNKTYYHKYFNVKAIIDEVTYVSNAVYSEDKLELNVERFGDDFTLKWLQIDGADSVKVYYAETKEGDFEVYEAAKLNGASIEHTIEDLDDVNKAYDNHYFKIAAVLDGYEIVSNIVKIDVSKELPSIDGSYENSGNYLIAWQDVSWDVDEYKLYYREDTTENEITTSEYKEMTTTPSHSGSDYEATISGVATSDYKEKFVRVVAIDGYLKVFSNRVYIEDPTINGELNDLFAEEDTDLKVGNRKDIILDFEVYKDMFLPYIKFDLKGSKYLMFNKMSAALEKKDGTDYETIEVNLITETNEETGNVFAYIHPVGETSKFLPNEEYRLTFNTTLSPNTTYDDEIYAALEAYGNSENLSLKRWALPYYITKLQVNGEEVDSGLDIRIEAHWNTDDSESSGDERQIFKELFDIDIDAKDKNKLPGSM